MSVLIGIGAVIAVLVILALLIAAFFSTLFRKVPQGKALVVSTMNDVVVSFTGRVVLPVIHKAEIMDTSVKTIEIDRRATEGLICRDNIRADIKVNFFVRVNNAEEDVIKVAQAIGVDRASQQETLEELFTAKFSEALKTVGKRLDFIDLYTERRRFRDEIIEVIGTDLNGYVLEDAAIDYLEQTPLSSLDDTNILDAQGIRKITELTALEHVATNVATREEEKQITQKDVETREAVLELQRQQADAEARQSREIQTVRAREEAETAKIAAEEHLRAETARLATEQDVGVQQENLMREVEVAERNRLRVVAVEEERITKARELEIIARELETVGATKGLELEKTEIAEIVAKRTSVEKSVAEEEEAIKTLRVVEDANRHRDATVIEAEAEAEGAFVKDIKAAEAAEKAAQHKATERVTISRADLEASDLDAKAMVRLAEGAQAEAAAKGLAEVTVKEADAIAIEKVGLAEVRVREADAGATQKEGAAEAAVVRDMGTAEAHAAEAILRGEAAGLTDKAAAMRELEGVGQEFEEFTRRLDAQKEVDLAKVEAQVGIANAQADALKAGLESADIDIVGGSDIFVDRLVGAVAGGKSVDAFVENSGTTSKLFGKYLDGDGDIVADLTELTAGLGGSGLRDLTISAFLAQAMKNSDGEMKSKLSNIIDAVAKEGIGDLPIGDL